MCTTNAIMVKLLLFICIYTMLRVVYNNFTLLITTDMQIKMIDTKYFTLNKPRYKNYDMVILFWTTIFGESDVVDMDGQRNLSIICNISTSDKINQNILITPDKSLRKLASALIFHGRDTSLKTINNSHKQHNDIYVLYNMESPVNWRNVTRDSKVLSSFNLLMSYPFYSDITEPYLAFDEFKTWINQKNKHSFKEKNNTNADVLWIGNNCYAQNGRQDYLIELFKYISVHSLGECLHINPNNITIPPRSQYGIDISDIVSKYKFYLSFENSQCEDYITEKLLKALKATTIPVVFSVNGLPNYDKFLPSHSYINAANFKSAKQLAQYLKFVGSNEHLYNSFFDFKSTQIMRQDSLHKIMKIFNISNNNKWCGVANAVYKLHQNRQYNKTITSSVSIDNKCINSKVMTKYANESINITNINNKTVINLTIIVPVRQRDRHLTLFTNYITDYIQKYDKNIHLSNIIAVEQLQSDNVSFNRAALLNIGFNYISNSSEVQYIALHDVDWIPATPTSYYPMRPDIHFQHIMPVNHNYLLKYPIYVGGASIVSKYAFKNCLNGFSNQYFGWGAEDDDLYFRLDNGIYLPQCILTKINFINTSRPELPVYADYDHLNTNTSYTLPTKYHYRSKNWFEPRNTTDYKWNSLRLKIQQSDKNGHLLRNDGLSNMLKYEIIDKQIFGKLTIIQVELFRNDSWHNM